MEFVDANIYSFAVCNNLMVLIKKIPRFEYKLISKYNWIKQSLIILDKEL